MPVRICVVGSANMDLSLRVPRLPHPGETLAALSFATCPGGKGANQAVMAARLGAQVTLVGRVGADLFGSQLLHSYAESGVDTTHVRRDPRRPTGVATILVEENGVNRILLAPGANAGLTAGDVERAKDALRSADVVLCQGEVPLGATAAALKIAGEGAMNVFNLSPYQRVPDALLEKVDVLVVNETEMAQLAGLSNRSTNDLERAAKSVWERAGAEVIVTLGERGALFVGASGPEWIETIAVDAVDTTGAGDAFVGALAVDITRKPWATALRRALAIAALTVTRPGTQSSYPSRREAGAWLRRHGV